MGTSCGCRWRSSSGRPRRSGSPAARRLAGPLDHFSDFYTGSLGAFAGIGITQMIEAFVSFDFLNLYGKKPPGVGAADWRSLVVGANFNY